MNGRIAPVRLTARQPPAFNAAIGAACEALCVPLASDERLLE
jgi:hypothetical protein